MTPTTNIACECDYDCEGDPLQYVKTSHNCCPWHDSCSWCGDNMGVERVDKDWVCQRCLDEEISSAPPSH